MNEAEQIHDQLMKCRGELNDAYLRIRQLERELEEAHHEIDDQADELAELRGTFGAEL